MKKYPFRIPRKKKKRLKKGGYQLIFKDWLLYYTKGISSNELTLKIHYLKNTVDFPKVYDIQLTSESIRRLYFY